MAALFIFILVAATAAKEIMSIDFTDGYYLALCEYSSQHNNTSMLPHAIYSSWSLDFGSGSNNFAYAITEQTVLKNAIVSNQFTVNSTLDAFNSYYNVEMRDDIHFYGRLLINPSNPHKIRPSDTILSEYSAYAPTQMECDASVAALNYTTNVINVVINTWNLAQNVTELETLREMMRDDLFNGTYFDYSSFYQVQFANKGVTGEWFSARAKYVIVDNDFSAIYHVLGNPNEWSQNYKRYTKCFNTDTGTMACFWLYGIKAITSNATLKQKWLKWKLPSTDNSKSEKKDNSARVLGIIVLVLMIIGIVVAAVLYVLKKRKEKKQSPLHGVLLEDSQFT